MPFPLNPVTHMHVSSQILHLQQFYTPNIMHIVHFSVSIISPGVHKQFHEDKDGESPKECIAHAGESVANLDPRLWAISSSVNGSESTYPTCTPWWSAGPPFTTVYPSRKATLFLRGCQNCWIHLDIRQHTSQSTLSVSCLPILRMCGSQICPAHRRAPH